MPLLEYGLPEGMSSRGAVNTVHAPLRRIFSDVEGGLSHPYAFPPARATGYVPYLVVLRACATQARSSTAPRSTCSLIVISKYDWPKRCNRRSLRQRSHVQVA